ncbi:Hypothetical protein R9X50_00651400 [Acrodontium crateriforme]|uniref:Uncharacterized protein n=1 Tax=Acrodontium crateriforme TaxID=150365 RepID=A0AAQ3RBL5_9PEZI|nr:Hypothetical protein R9X50_00651400 [Acrodontium crateriforme]
MVAAAASSTSSDAASSTSSDALPALSQLTASHTSTASSSSSSSPASSSSSNSFVATATSSGSAYHLTGLPTIAGAGIPTIVIPNTANAPYMQKSTLPQGTVFIAIGAILAFLGACVLVWRGVIAWSINRSVKKAALASMLGGSEKLSSAWGPTGYQSAKNGMYKDLGSSMSLDVLNSNGKNIKSQHDAKRDSTAPAGLFFSPTANPSGGIGANRSSTYLPAGYYAAPSAQAAGGSGATTIGGNLAPHRQSVVGQSPPSSPGVPSRSIHRPTSRDGLRAASRDGGFSSARNSYMDLNQRSGSLAVGGQNSDELTRSRAPSAYLDEMFENHGNGPRERY